MPTPARSHLGATVRAAVAPVLTLAVAAGYVGADLAGALTEPPPAAVAPLVHGGLVVLQAIALLFRGRVPLTVLPVVVGLDLAILATSGGELGIGALAVIVATYAAIRRGRPRRRAYVVVAAAALATAIVDGAAMIAAGVPVLVTGLAVGARIALLTALPAAAAEYMIGRERLAHATREQAAAAERERRAAAEAEVRAERTALARELHDIAGHHLSGIIVSAQAASALTRTDPEQARETLQALQQNARTALADLRRTVGLLRTEDEGPSGAPGTTPAVAEIRALIETARARGQDVTLQVDGERAALSPLAETAAYRMVQESLANAARHAPGTVCRVRIEYRPDAAEVTVRNGAPVGAIASSGTAGGYGIAGMRERADLVGATLSTGPQTDGGWCNRLTIPLDHERSAR